MTPNPKPEERPEAPTRAAPTQHPDPRRLYRPDDTPKEDRTVFKDWASI